VAIIKFTVPAVPVAQPRTKATAFGGKARVYTPTTLGTGDGKRPHPIHAFKATVRLAAEVYNGAPIAGPVRIDVLFVFPRHSSKVWKSKPMPRYPHVEKPDIDNLIKSVLDALQGTIIVDDCQVYAGTIEKWRASGDEQPHCAVSIREVTE